MNKIVFENHREFIGSLMENNSILISFSRRKDTGPVEEKHSCDRNYFYITGVMEYDNITVISKLNNTVSSMIFINPYDEFKAKWVGAPLDKETVTEISGITDVKYLETFEQTLNMLCGIAKNVYLDLAPNGIHSLLTEDEAFAKNISEHKPWIHILNSRPLFTKARTVKCEEELDMMRKAISITNKGILNILDNLKESYEYQLESYFDQAIKYNGATGYAFGTIAASGKNSCCLHYSNNDCVAHNGDLILFDLGASCDMYCSDISRTFPISGKFTERQKTIYNIVLGGQQVVFDNVKPGITTRELNQILVKYYAVELKKIGLIKNDEEVSKYYYHGVSHHIGLDCHDLCEYTPLKAGCVISNEPGLYIAEENIGIRIEDDVLVTETGAEWMSKEIIKTVDDIEAYLGGRK